MLDTSDILSVDELKFGIGTKVHTTIADMYYKPMYLHSIVADLDKNLEGFGRGHINLPFACKSLRN
jgi:hypothetical protein